MIGRVGSEALYRTRLFPHHCTSFNSPPTCRSLSSISSNSQFAVAGPLVLFHDGNLSNRNQTRALAHAIGIKCQRTIEVNISKPEGRRIHVENGLVIGCGRRVAPIVSSYHGRNNNKAVQILHPRLLLSTARFDCLVVPYHDRLSWFDNPAKIIRMHGALSWSLHSVALQRYRTPSSNTRICVLIGGGLDDARNIIAQLELLARMPGQEVHVICSRRTPRETIEELLKANLTSVWHLTSVNERNPYRKMLANGDIFLVSEDSASMIADVLTVVGDRRLSPPIYLLPSSSTTRHKHRLYVEGLSARHGSSGFVSPFQSAEQLVQMRAPRGTMASPGFENETMRVGKAVRHMLGGISG